MKVAIVVPHIHEGGGVPAVARYLCEVLKEHECQLISVSTAKNDRHSVRLLSPITWFRGVQVYRSSWEGHSIMDVGAVFTELEFQRYMPRSRLTKLLNEYDIVQVVAGAPAWAYLAKNLRVPVFLQVATLVREERKQQISCAKGIRKLYLMLSTAITSAIEERALHRMDLVFVENLWMKCHVEERIGRERTVMAPPGVDANHFTPGSIHNRPETKYIVSVGRFNDPRKNVQLLFEAYRDLRNLNRNAPLLVLAGLSGPSDMDWQIAERLGIRQYIIFKHDIPAGELVELLRNAELFVCSSEEEGLGIAMLEALACGAPVVTTRCGGPETFMEDGVNGYLVDKNDSSQLADKINNILTDRKLHDYMRAAARKTVETSFSNDVTSKIFSSNYARFSSGTNTICERSLN